MNTAQATINVRMNAAGKSRLFDLWLDALEGVGGYADEGCRLL